MNLKTETKLVNASLKLKDLNRIIDRNIKDSSAELTFDHLEEYLRLKKEIKTLLVDISYANIRNVDAREIVRKISMDEPFFADELIKLIEIHHEQKTGEKIKYDELTAYSGDSGHPIRSIPAGCSGGFRPLRRSGATLELRYI